MITFRQEITSLVPLRVKTLYINLEIFKHCVMSSGHTWYFVYLEQSKSSDITQYLYFITVFWDRK